MSLISPFRSSTEINESKNYITITTKKDINLCIENFSKYILSNHNNLPQLYQKLLSMSLQGKIEFNLLRPTLYKISLGILPKDMNISLEDWVYIIESKRKAYLSKSKKSKTTKMYSGNPLDNNSEWGTYFKDQELIRIIQLDVDRTFQEHPLYRDDSIKKILQSILLIWSKEHKEISYRQGMNEILGTLLYLLYPYYIKTDHIMISKEQIAIVNEESYAKELYYFFHNEKYLEADLYWMYNELMKEGVASLYEINITDEMKIKNNNKKLKELFEAPFEKNGNCVIDKDNSGAKVYNRSIKILKEKLIIYDEELYLHLEKNCVDSTMFLQRWLKCLFSREFLPLDTGILWDAILAQERDEITNGTSKELEFIDYIAVAMMIYIRDDLMGKDENECLRRLFKYPHIESTVTLINLAEKIKRRVTTVISNQRNSKTTVTTGELRLNALDSIDKTDKISTNKTQFQNDFFIVPPSMTNYLTSKCSKDLEVINQIKFKIAKQNKTMIDKLEELKRKYIKDVQSDDYSDCEFILEQLKAKLK